MPRKAGAATAAKRPTKVAPAPLPPEPVLEKSAAPEVVAEKEQEKQVFRVKDPLTPNTYVTVRNGFNGKLVYKSRRTNEKFVWDSFGAEQDIELQELKSARNASKTFFENNWFLIDDPEVIEYLGVGRFYKNALRYEDFDDLFKKSPDEIAKIIAEMPDGQRQSVVYRSKQLVADGTIDSIKVINVLEKSLGLELIER